MIRRDRAIAIGERLARLADRTQLLVVTHSPQVAARADRHRLIQKRSDGLVARTGVHVLVADERREEIARMLSAAEITDEARRKPPGYPLSPGLRPAARSRPDDHRRTITGRTEAS